MTHPPEIKADAYFDVREEIPFPDGSADEIYLSGVLAQIVSNEEFRTAMNECWRVLKEDGPLRIVVLRAPATRSRSGIPSIHGFSPRKPGNT